MAGPRLPLDEDDDEDDLDVLSDVWRLFIKIHHDKPSEIDVAPWC